METSLIADTTGCKCNSSQVVLRRLLQLLQDDKYLKIFTFVELIIKEKIMT